jgi:hypothetical protein
MSEQKDDLAKAFHSVRDTYQGKSPDPDPEATLERALFRSRAQERKQRLTRWVFLPIAAALLVSTAWAGVTGRLGIAVHTIVEGTHPERTQDPAPPTSAPAAPPAQAPSPDPEPEPDPTTPSANEPAPSIAAIPAPPAAAPPPSTLARVEKEKDSPPAPPTPPTTIAAWPAASASDPNAPLFAEAHRVHFTERDPARAIVAWDRYLSAAPNGRFIPEARYNRAISLVRVGRRDEAHRELQAFASGTYGSYRQREATALLNALDRDAAP